MDAVSGEDYWVYMNDAIHPTQAGYLKWWTPKFESYLADLFAFAQNKEGCHEV